MLSMAGWLALKLASRLSRLLGLPAQRRRLETQVAGRTRELEALYAIAAEASRSLDLQEILASSLEKTLEVIGVEAGGIYLLRENDGILALAAHSGLEPSFVEAIDKLQVGEGFSGRVVQTGESIVVSDLARDPRLSREVVRQSNFQAAAMVPIQAKGRVFGSLFLISRRERSFAAQDLALLTSIGRQIGVATEHTRLFSAEQRRAEQFRVIAEVGRRVTSILDIDVLLQEMARLIQQAFGYYHVGVGLIEGDEVVYRVGSGVLWDDPFFDYWPARLKVGEEGISGWVASTGRPLLAPDVGQEPRYVWMRGSQTRSELAVPIKAKGQVIGVLDAQSDRRNAFDEVDVVVLQALAHQAGTAIENVRLYEQAQQSAVTAERTRLARELHDAVTQTLFSASLLAEALPQAWERDPGEGRQVVAELRQLSRGALAEMRTLLLELRPAALVEADLGDLLRQLAEAASGREGLPVEVAVECHCHLPDEVHVALYRIAQEALNNVVKHSRADRACVELHCSKCGSITAAPMSQIVTLTIGDNGRGFDPGHVPPERMGLGIMRERAESVGATLAITSQPGAGAQIKVQWTTEGDAL